MKTTDKQTGYLIRERVLKVLSEGDLTKVSTAASWPGLQGGDAYVDLEALERGIRYSAGSEMPKGRVLLRKAVDETTWAEIMREIGNDGTTQRAGQRAGEPQ